MKGESWKFKLMADICAAMNRSGNKQDFLFKMERYGYQVKWTDERKYITFTCPNRMKFRDIKLHDDKYLKENLEYELLVQSLFLPLQLCLPLPKALLADGVLDLAGILLSQLLIHPGGDKLAGEKLVPLINLLCHLPAQAGQEQGTVSVNLQEPALFQQPYRVANAGFAKIHVSGQIN